jgi:hypothetical protein
VAAIAAAVAAAGGVDDAKAVFAKCIYGYEAEKEGDLTLTLGAIVTMSANQDFSGDWWYGAIGESEPGYFPASYVETIKEEEAFPEQAGDAPAGAAAAVAAVGAEENLGGSVDEKQPAQTGWRQERDLLKARLNESQLKEEELLVVVSELERQKGNLLKDIAELNYGAGSGKGGVMYDIEKLLLGTYFETDAMGETVGTSTELCHLLKEFAHVLEKGFEKEKDVAQEKDLALKSIAEVTASSQEELQAISLLSNTKDKFSDVLKKFQQKADEIE